MAILYDQIDWIMSSIKVSEQNLPDWRLQLIMLANPREQAKVGWSWIYTGARTSLQIESILRYETPHKMILMVQIIPFPE